MLRDELAISNFGCGDGIALLLRTCKAQIIGCRNMYALIQPSGVQFCDLLVTGAEENHVVYSRNRVSHYP
jgi:hypothetical protein